MLEKELIPHLNTSKPFIIIGEFNLDIHGKQKTLLQKLCRTFSCEMLMNEPTTDNSSTLDLVFSNISGNTGTVETYWSNHKFVYFHSNFVGD